MPKIIRYCSPFLFPGAGRPAAQYPGPRRTMNIAIVIMMLSIISAEITDLNKGDDQYTEKNNNDEEIQAFCNTFVRRFTEVIERLLNFKSEATRFCENHRY